MNRLRRSLNFAARLPGGLDFALHKPANVAHGDCEIVLSLQVNPELRSVAENNGRGVAP
jgi:hypothetical protein